MRSPLAGRGHDVREAVAVEVADVDAGSAVEARVDVMRSPEIVGHSVPATVLGLEPLNRVAGHVAAHDVEVAVAVDVDNCDPPRLDRRYELMVWITQPPSAGEPSLAAHENPPDLASTMSRSPSASMSANVRRPACPR